MQLMMRARADRSLLTVEEALAADREFFAEHPECDAYVREFVPGEFGKAELPEIPAGFRYATHVAVIERVAAEAVARHRNLLAVCDDPIGSGLRPAG